MTTGERFAHPEYLVDAAWVEAHKNDANVVMVDCDVDQAYRRGHIPGSVMVPDNYEKNPDTGRVHLMNPGQFSAMCQGLGIGDDTLVIAYDSNQSNYAARLWWALNTHGHSNVKVLDGGWRRWITEGRAISFNIAHPASGVKFTPKADDSMMVRVDELKAACNVSDAVLWDVRSAVEWNGTNSRGNKRVGHVPGAVHLDWWQTMDRETHRFKPPEEIRRILAEKGITPNKKVYAY